MLKRLSLLICLLIPAFSRLLAQGAPACPDITAGTHTNVCQGACVALTSTLVTNNQTTSYNVASIPYAPYSFTGTQVLNGTDDLWSQLSPIGFNFCYYGTSYSQMVIGSNGEITFDATQAGAYNGWSISTALPNTVDLPANTICGAFRDIDPSQGGDIYYQTVGSSPCRALVISWVNVPLFDVSTACAGTPNSTFQIVLYENTNYIDVYIQNSSACAGWNSGYGEVGIEDPTGTIAVVPPNRNYPNAWTAVNEAWRFSPSGAPSYTVTWTDPGGVVGTGQTVNVCPATSTTYTATMVLTNCNGSQLTVSDTVSIGITPGTAITVNSPTICAGATATLTANGGTTYTWSANAGGATTSSVSVSPGATTVYTVTSNGGGGGNCAPIATSTVTVVPSLSVTVNTPPAMCAGQTATLTASGATNYTWSPGTGLSGTTGGTVTATPATTTNYTVTGTSGSCPAATATTVVAITATSTITINSATICPTSQATLTANGSANYNWSPGTGLSATSGSVVTAQPAATTVYTVSGTGSCVTAGTCTVTVVPSCSISVNSATICPTQQATLTANGGGPYTWSPATGLSSTSGGSVTASPPSTTVYTVTSTSGGFTATATATVTVNASPTISVNNSTICQGASANLLANGAIGYTWTPSAGLSSTTGANVTASPTVTTTYTITGISANGCTNTATSVIGVNSAPVVTLGPLNSVGCAPLCVNFTSTSTSPTQSADWNFGDGNGATGTSANYCYNAEGTYNITLTLTDFNGCVGTATVSATVYPVPQANFNAAPQPATILDPNIQFTDQTTGAVITNWLWDFGDVGLHDTSRVKNPKHLYGDTGTYFTWLYVTTAYGCKDSTVKVIRIDDDYELFVPTAFSPNADGLNEIFLPLSRGISPESYRMYVFDRWGNLIFQTSNIDKGWDGTRKGDVVLEDVYVWKIELKTTQGIKKSVHGQVSVVK